MALSGTLKDFGIADILQLIGHQTKTGTLVLKSGNDEVDVLFVDGTVVFATQKARNKADLLGSLLLRAELITEEKLQEALTEQQRSLKRLGDVLVHQNYVEPERLSQVMRLQTTETLYKLFRWKTGTYEFTQEDVDAGKSGFEPTRGRRRRRHAGRAPPAGLPPCRRGPDRGQGRRRVAPGRVRGAQGAGRAAGMGVPQGPAAGARVAGGGQRARGERAAAGEERGAAPPGVLGHLLRGDPLPGAPGGARLGRDAHREPRP